MTRLLSIVATATGALFVFARLAHAQPKLEPQPPPETAPLQATAPARDERADTDFGVPADAGAAGSHAVGANAADAGAAPSALGEGPRPGSSTQPTGKEVWTSFKGSVGYQYAQVHGVPITGGRLRLGLGGQNDALAFYGVLSMLYGSTEEGLRTWDVRGALNADLVRAGILRLGGDVEMGYLVVRRATVDARMWALGLGAGLHVSVDVYPFGPREDHAVFIEGKVDAHLHFGSAFMWGPSVLAGIRY